ncbi:MAG: YraN family protein [Leadbetterella sp.]
MTEKLEIGKRGEDFATEYLTQKGYKIVARNYRAKNSEIDIICKKDTMLVFVEVRLKYNADYGYPEDTMSKSKKNAIFRGATAYLEEFPWVGESRFDFISIIEKPEFELIHFEDAFH